MSTNRIRVLLVSLLAVFAVSAIGAGAAQAEGPVWITKAGVLGAGATKTITHVEAIGNQTLTSGTLTITCTDLEINTEKSNKIIGGNPGTDEAHLEFTGCTAVKEGSKCNVKSSSPEAGSNTTEIKVPVKTLLGYKVAGKIKAKSSETEPPAYDQFFPPEEKELFVKLEFSGSECGALKGTETEVTATGSGVKGLKGFEKAHCGVITEVGKISATNAFELANNKELFKKGGLRAPTTAVKTEKVENEKGEFVEVTCGLKVALTGVATQSGVGLVEVENGEEFGVEV